MGKISQRTHKEVTQDRGTGTGDSDKPTKSEGKAHSPLPSHFGSPIW